MKKSAIILISITALAGLLFTGCNRYNTAAGAGEGVSEQNAAQTALSHAGLAEQDVQSLTVSKTTKEGADVYAVTFSTEEKTYVYDIERDNGEIISFSFQAAGEDGVSSPDKDDAPSAQTSTDTTSKTDTPPQTGAASTASANDTSGKTNAASSKASSTSAITAAQAQAIALTHAGVAEEDTQLLRVKEDWDDGIAIYEVEFYAGNREYDYDIARDTGKILQFDYDIEGYAPASSNGTILSLEEARQLALSKVKGATDRDIHIELDWDDGRQIYEGEIYFDRMEYEFEIVASSGDFIKWSVDYDD